MLSKGQNAPAFTGIDQHGNTVSLDDFAGQKLILYFYPKDDTPGCTDEACSFRDNYAAFDDAGVAVVGVSADTVESHKAFADKHNLSFPLIADPDQEIIERYDVASGEGYAERATYVINEDGMITTVYPDVDPEQHVETILAEL